MKILRYRMIAAIDENGAIGYQGELPFSLRKDIRYFRDQITGGIVIGTRATVNQVGKPPQGTRLWGISRQEEGGPHWQRRFSDWRKAVEEANRAGEIPWVIGGEWLFSEALQEAEELYLTLVEGTYPADRYFPELWATQFPVVVSDQLEQEGETSFRWQVRRPGERQLKIDLAETTST